MSDPVEPGDDLPGTRFAHVGLGSAAPDAPLLVYVELACPKLDASHRFFAAAFGWPMIDYGEAYAGAFAGAEAGLHGEGPARPPLPGIRVADLAAAEQAVRAAGGEIVVPAADFPGGRRFQCREPSGNELLVFVYD